MSLEIQISLRCWDPDQLEMSNRATPPPPPNWYGKQNPNLSVVESDEAVSIVEPLLNKVSQHVVSHLKNSILQFTQQKEEILKIIFNIEKFKATFSRVSNSRCGL